MTAAGSVAVVRPATTGMTASAVRLAVRAIALLTPEATLTWSASTAPMTVAVSGATNVTRPSPKRTAPGSDVTYPRRVGTDAAEREQPGGEDQRPDGELNPWPDPLRERAGAGRAEQHQHGGRQQGAPEASADQPAATCNW